MTNGRAVVPSELILLLGDGSADGGRRVLEQIVRDLRDHRILMRVPAVPSPSGILSS